MFLHLEGLSYKYYVSMRGKKNNTFNSIDPVLTLTSFILGSVRLDEFRVTIFQTEPSEM